MDENVNFVVTGTTAENEFFAATARSLQDCIIQLSQELCLETYDVTDAESWYGLYHALRCQGCEVNISVQIMFDEDDPYIEEIFDKLY